jgi:hypothetical protein
MATDISMHSNSELADWFDNDEYLYNQARVAVDFNDLEELARMVFIFNDEQLDEFRSDWADGRWD